MVEIVARTLCGQRDAAHGRALWERLAVGEASAGWRRGWWQSGSCAPAVQIWLGAGGIVAFGNACYVRAEAR